MASVPLPRAALQAASQVDVPHVRRGAGLVQFVLGLGCVALLLTELLQAAEQHGLDLLLAGFQAILERQGPTPESQWQPGAHSRGGGRIYHPWVTPQVFPQRLWGLAWAAARNLELEVESGASQQLCQMHRDVL